MEYQNITDKLISLRKKIYSLELLDKLNEIAISMIEQDTNIERFVYVNRYSNEFVFLLSNEKILMVSPSDQTYRTSNMDSKMKTFIDPSGGPYISIGSNLGFIDERLTNFTVSTIEQSEDGFILHPDIEALYSS